MRKRVQKTGSPLYMPDPNDSNVNGIRESDGIRRDVNVFDLEHHYLKKQPGISFENLPPESFKKRRNEMVLLREE